jgi:hypothetical protein
MTRTIIELDDVELKIKSDIDLIFGGEGLYCDPQMVADVEELQYLKKFSFLLNYIEFNSIDGRPIIRFQYLDHGNFSIDLTGYYGFTQGQIKDYIYHEIRNSDQFKESYIEFSRNFKINKLGI